jgi:hypothetical protein
MKDKAFLFHRRKAPKRLLNKNPCNSLQTELKIDFGLLILCRGSVVMKSRFLGIVCAAALCLFSTQASAFIVSGSFAGTSGDLSGVFQNVDGSDVSGQSVSGSFSFNFDELTSATSPTPGLYRYLFLSGSFFTVTIGTHTFSFVDYESGFIQLRDAPNSFAFFDVLERVGTIANLPFVQVDAPPADLFDDPADPSTVHIAGLPGTLNMGSFEGNGTSTIYADWQIALDTVTVSVSAVPELSTWAMMVMGFACIGTMVYRRRRQVVVIAA